METEVGNMFGVAKEAEKPKAATKSKDYQEVILRDSDYPNISNSLEKLTEVRQELATMKSTEGKYALHVKGIAQREYLKLYEATGRNPETFIIRGEQGGAIMVLPTRKYGAVDVAKAEYLTEAYGSEIVEETTTFIFNSAIINKGDNMQKLSAAIQASELSAEDKAALIEPRTTRSLNKEAIDRIGEFDMPTALMDFAPVFQLKNHA